MYRKDENPGDKSL